jgi:RNA polymerase sigma factor (sigma-70 family)
MVFGVCLNVLSKRQDAEDAFQLVFITFSAKASKLLSFESVGGWLHETSLRTSLCLRRKLGRIREVNVDKFCESTASKQWRRITQECETEKIHKEIVCLPPEYKSVIVLCCLEGKSRSEAAAILNKSAVSIKGTLSRARKMLRLRLLRQGIATVAPMAIATNIFANSSQTVTESMIQSTLQTCCDPVAPATSGMASLPQRMFQGKFTSSVLSVAAGVLFFGVGAFSLFCFNVSLRSTLPVEIVTTEEQRPLTVVSLEQVLLLENEVGEQDNDQDEEIGSLERSYRELQTKAVRVELRMLKRELDLEDDWGESLLDSLKGDINSAAHEMLYNLESKHAGFGFSFTDSLESKLRVKLWEKIQASIPEDKRANFVAVKNMMYQLQKLKDATGLNGLLVYLDNELCLSVEQVDRLRELYSNGWNSLRNDEAGMLAASGLLFGRETIDAVDKEVLAEVFTDKQLDVFERLGKNSNFVAMIKRAKGQEAEKVTVEVKAACDLAFRLKTAEYHEMVDASEEQLKLLSIGRKGAIAKVAERFVELLEIVAQDPSATYGLNATSMEVKEPFNAKCVRTPAWQKTLSKTFDEAQLKKIHQREAQRKEFRLGQLLDYTVFANFHSMGFDPGLQGIELGLTFEQHEDLVAAVRDRLDADALLNVRTIISAIRSVSEERFNEILDQEQLDLLKPWLEKQ